MQEHFVHIHKDRAFLLEAASAYLQDGLRRGQAALVIARPKLREALAADLGSNHALFMLDAERTLGRIMSDGMPDWRLFEAVVGGLIRDLHGKHPGVVAYGEMVDILWQQGREDAAIRLEEFLIEIGRRHPLSLFCAYHLDCLDRSEAVDRICKVHARLIPARDSSLIDIAVSRATEEELDRPLSQVLLSLAESHRDGAKMPAGPSMLLWLHRNMPRTAGRVLARVRESMAMEIA